MLISEFHMKCIRKSCHTVGLRSKLIKYQLELPQPATAVSEFNNITNFRYIRYILLFCRVFLNGDCFFFLLGQSCGILVVITYLL